MIMKITAFLSMLLCLLYPSFALMEEIGTGSQDVRGPSFYIEKGNRGEQISIKEFKALMKQLESEITDLNKTVSETTVWGSNMPYEIGKSWEMEIELTKKNIEVAFKHLDVLRNNPNSMASSAGLYAGLANIDRSLLYFDKIPHFEKSLGKRHVGLFMWRLAFERSHLFPLALAKDAKRDLYVKQK